MAEKDRAVVFGGMPEDYLREWQITSDLDVAREKLGVEIEVVPGAKLTERMADLDDGELADAAFLAEELLEHAEDGGTYPPPGEAQVVKAVRLYVAMRAITREGEAVAVTVNCAAVKHADSPVPCVALTLFQESGMPAACQADLDAFLTTILFWRAGAMPTFLGGAEKRGELVRVGHCVLPRNMGGLDGPPAPYRLSKYHGQTDSPTIETEAPVGRTVTVARLTRNAGRLLLTRGRIVDNLHEPPHCVNALLLDLEDALGFMEHVPGRQYHLVAACGDQVSEMQRLAAEAGADVVP